MAMGWTFIEIQRGDDLVMLPNSQVGGVLPNEGPLQRQFGTEGWRLSAPETSPSDPSSPSLVAPACMAGVSMLGTASVDALAAET